MGNVDYKKKYMELRSVLMNVIDQVYRAGYQQGSKDAQVDSLMQQNQQLMAQMSGMMGGMMGGEPRVEEEGGPMAPEDQAGQFMDSAADAHEQQGTSELEQGIAELESELSKKEADKEHTANLLAAINRSLGKLKEAQELKKSAAHIKKMREANKRVQTLSIGYKHNLSKTHKKAVNKQQEIVEKILKKWESESQDAATEILGIVQKEGKAE